MTEEEILKVADFIYANAKDNTQKSLAEKTGVSPNRISQLITLMRKEGVEVKTSGGTMGLYRSAIRKFIEAKKGV